MSPGPGPIFPGSGPRDPGDPDPDADPCFGAPYSKIFYLIYFKSAPAVTPDSIQSSCIINPGTEMLAH